MNGDGGCRQHQLREGLTAGVGWLRLRVSVRLALSYIHQMNPMNSRNDLCHDDSIINIVKSIIIIIIIIIIIFIFIFTSRVKIPGVKTKIKILLLVVVVVVVVVFFYPS